MVNRKRLKIKCRGRELSGKNLDVVFWGKDYVEGYECKGNVEFFLELGLRGGEKGRKVKEKVWYLNQLAYILKKLFKEALIYLASFAPSVNVEKCKGIALKWVEECGSKGLHFEIITVKDFLSKLP